MYSFCMRNMQTQQERDAQMRARVASTAIEAQKVADEFQRPEITISRALKQRRVSDAPMHGFAHADVKDSEAGLPSTFLAANHYISEAKKRRDELLAKYKGEEEQS